MVHIQINIYILYLLFSNIFLFFIILFKSSLKKLIPLADRVLIRRVVAQTKVSYILVIIL